MVIEGEHGKLDRARSPLVPGYFSGTVMKICHGRRRHSENYSSVETLFFQEFFHVTHSYGGNESTEFRMLHVKEI